MAKIELTGICKTFSPPSLFSSRGFILNPRKNKLRGAPFAIQNLNLTIPHGKTLVVLGPSGCGKSTLLRIIAGLLRPDAGEVKYDGVDVVNVPPGKRRIGMIFQNYALYPHLSSKTNILSYFYFRPKTPQLDAAARAKYKRTSELLGVDIRYLEDRSPDTLSGGEKQRVALGRCITRDPALFLLDEPFSNLDQALREKYRVNLKVLLNQFKITTVYVTHDQHEALILADALAIMDGGRIEQFGTYEGIYNRPKNLFVAQFLNPDPSTLSINLIDGRYLVPSAPDMMVGVRPEEIALSMEAKEGSLGGSIASLAHLPTKLGTIMNIRVGEYEVVVRMPSEQRPALGSQMWLTFKQYHLFAKDTGLRVKSLPL